MFGLYVHIPFCLAKCRYCDFPSRPARPGEIARYLEALLREIAAAPERGRRADTVYLGGGTPSLLRPEQTGAILAALRAAFVLEEDAEITLEANPGTLGPGTAAALRELGVNRVSLGVQSLDDAQLRRLGRTHTAAEAVDAFRALRRAGFRNVGLDLMHSLPGQTVPAWREELERAAALGAEHLSLYALCVEEGTAFAAAQARGELPRPAEEEEAAMLATSAEIAAAAGYERYEISNFSRPGRRCRHNANGWSFGEYRGFGAAAHSFLRAPAPERLANVADVTGYLRSMRERGRALASRERPSARRLAGEAAMLALRTCAGIDEEAFAATHGARWQELFREAATLGAARGWLVRRAGRARLSAEGMLFSDALFRRLF